MVQSKETALYQENKIGDDIANAAGTATTYITRIDDNGITVHPSSGSDDRVAITGSGVEIFNDGTSIANYSSNIRIGKDPTRYQTGNVYIDGDGVKVRKGGTVLSEFGANKISLGKASDSAEIDMCNSSLVINTEQYTTEEGQTGRKAIITADSTTAQVTDASSIELAVEPVLISDFDNYNSIYLECDAYGTSKVETKTSNHSEDGYVEAETISDVMLDTEAATRITATYYDGNNDDRHDAYVEVFAGIAPETQGTDSPQTVSRLKFIADNVFVSQDRGSGMGVTPPVFSVLPIPYTPTWASGETPSKYACIKTCGICHFFYQGASKKHSEGARIGTLPEYCRPDQQTWIPFVKFSSDGHTYGALSISTAGIITVGWIASTSLTGRIYANGSFYAGQDNDVLG